MPKQIAEPTLQIGIQLDRIFGARCRAMSKHQSDGPLAEGQPVSIEGTQSTGAEFELVSPAEMHVVEHVTFASSRFSGPLPPPQALKAYEDACPGAARDIMNMALANQVHRHELEKTQQAGKLKVSLRGQSIGGLLSVAGLATIWYALYLNQPWVATAVGLAEIIGLARVFVLGRSEIEASKDRKLDVIDRPEPGPPKTS